VEKAAWGNYQQIAAAGWDISQPVPAKQRG